MHSISEQISAMNGGPATGHHPDPTVRTCPFCLGRHEFRADWTCSGCGEESTMHTDVTDCEKCRGRRHRRYNRNHLLSDRCDCKRTREEKARWEKTARDLERARKREEQEEAARRADWEAKQVSRVRAQACWVQSGYSCDEPKDVLNICKHCVRWTSSSKLEGEAV